MIRIWLSSPSQRRDQVSLAQHRQKGKSGLPGGQHLVEGALQQPLPLEPVVVVAEAVDAVLPGEVGLGLARLGQAQVVEAEVRRQLRLVVAPEQRLGLGDVGPLRESLPPPFVVLGDGVELGEVEGDESRQDRASWRKYSHLTSCRMQLVYE